MTRRVEVAEHWAHRLAHAGLPDVTDLLAHSPATRAGLGQWQALTKPGLGGRERWRWALNAADGAVLYVKRYTHTPLTEQLDRARRQTCCHSRAWWEYQQSALLTRQYVPVVQAIAFAEDMDVAFERCSVVLFEPVAGDALDRVWRKLTADQAALTRGPARHDLTHRLARFVSAFHQSGVCHRDLYLCHIFADVDPAAGRPPRFTLIDLARTHRPRLRRTRWLLKDLAQLDASARQVAATRTDRLRFLLTYLGLTVGAPRVRWYARRIVRWSDRILRRIARQTRRAAAKGPAA